MNWLLQPRSRILLALGALIVPCALWFLPRLSLVGAARAVLALCVAGVLWKLSLQRGSRAEPPRLRLAVCSRVSLSARCSLALVEVDERPYLVAFGDGFAQLSPMAAPAPERQAVFRTSMLEGCVQ